MFRTFDRLLPPVSVRILTTWTRTNLASELPRSLRERRSLPAPRLQEQPLPSAPAGITMHGPAAIPHRSTSHPMHQSFLRARQLTIIALTSSFLLGLASCSRTENTEDAPPSATGETTSSARLVAAAPSNSTSPSTAERTESSVATKPEAAVAETSAACPGWEVGMTGRAIASLEKFCRTYPPCPTSPMEAGNLELFGSLPSVDVFAEGILISYGSAEQGLLYAYSPKGKLVGASIWNQKTFGECRKKAIHYTGGSIPEPAADSAIQKCHYVPGRNLLKSQACRCPIPQDRPPLVGLDRGPRLKLSLDCLYELGAAGTLCRSTLLEQKAMPEVEVLPMDCGRTQLSSSSFDSACLYDRRGKLIEMRLGQRYISDGFETPCQP